ncbi:MAG: hypothetical protein ABIJ56_20470 [Pseudomonadota bacterium]
MCSQAEMFTKCKQPAFYDLSKAENLQQVKSLFSVVFHVPEPWHMACSIRHAPNAEKNKRRPAMKTKSYCSVTLTVAILLFVAGLSHADEEVQVNANAMNNADALFELLEQPQAAQPAAQPAVDQPEAGAPELAPKSLETLKDFFDRAVVRGFSPAGRNKTPNRLIN